MKKIFLTTVIFLFCGIILWGQNIDTIRFANWLNENSIELKGRGFDQLSNELKEKTVIGLGECIHGSKTINNIRFELAKNLIENCAIDNVAFELSFNTGLRINHFLQTGQGDIEKIIKESHFFINSTEMLDFIKWLKQYNDQSDRKINLYGFDIQSNIDLVEDIVKFYEQTDKNAEKLAATLLETLVDHNMGSFGDYPATLQDSVMKMIHALAEKHSLNKKDYILKAGYIEYEYLAKRIEVLSDQLTMHNSGYGQALLMRDSCNAYLIKWIKDFEGENSKVILFAHNGHLGKSLSFYPRVRTLSTQGFYEYTPQEFITGYYLREIFNDKYYFIGTQFGSGFFMGFDPENDYTLSKLEVTNPEINSFPYLLKLAKTKSPYFIGFNLSQSSPRQIIDYICSLQSFYEIGAAYDYKYAKTRLIEYFDAIIYIDNIEESNLLKFDE